MKKRVPSIITIILILALLLSACGKKFDVKSELEKEIKGDIGIRLLIINGEASYWAEDVDASNIENMGNDYYVNGTAKIYKKNSGYIGAIRFDATYQLVDGEFKMKDLDLYE